MARFLAIDWDPPKLNVLGVNIAKGRARVENSLALPLAQELTAATASAAGKALKDALGQAGLAAAPVLFSLGRDRVILKELSVPYTPAHEEPTIVRFQAAKEMTEAASDCVLDYALLASPKEGRQTPVQVVIVRKAIVAAITALCQAAGLKLHGIVPRPFALAGLLDRTTHSTILPITRGLLIPTGNEEAEFCVYAAERLVWARTLSIDPGLAGEVQKNLVLLATQKDDVPEVQRIETTGIAALGNLRVPKEPLEPWRDNDVKPQNPVAFLGALGLAELTARSVGLPVNLAAPKEAKPLVNNFERRKKFGLTLAIILVPLLLGGWYWNLSAMEKKIKTLQADKQEYDEQWVKLAQERADVAGIIEWEKTTISWLDELYDMAARLPHVEGLRITRLTATQIPKTAGKGNAHAGKIAIFGKIKKSEQVKEVQQFVEAIHLDGQYLRAGGLAFQKGSTDFSLVVDVIPRPIPKYKTPLVVTPEGQKAAVARIAALRRSAEQKSEALPPPDAAAEDDFDE